MVPHGSRGPASTRTFFASLLFSKLLNSHFLRFRRSLPKVLLSVALIPLPFLAPTRPNIQITNVPEVQISKNEAIFVSATPPIRIIPGESNSTRAEREHTEAVRKERYRQSLQSSGLGLPVIAEDALEMRIRDFLLTQQSPFATNVPEMIQSAVQSGIDPRLLAGISGAESTFGLHMPPGSHNPFGLGPARVFSSYKEAFQAESEFLFTHFGGKNNYNPYQIGPSYTGTGSTTWGPRVAQVMFSI